jgi:hypothetical protein
MAKQDLTPEAIAATAQALAAVEAQVTTKESW